MKLEEAFDNLKKNNAHEDWNNPIFRDTIVNAFLRSAMEKSVKCQNCGHKVSVRGAK